MRRCVFLVECDVPDDTDDEALYNILCDAEIMVAEPGTEFDVKTFNVASSATFSEPGQPAVPVESVNLDQKVAELAAPPVVIDGEVSVDQTEFSGRCEKHPEYDADYCPRCGTATVII